MEHGGTKFVLVLALRISTLIFDSEISTNGDIQVHQGYRLNLCKSRKMIILIALLKIFFFAFISVYLKIKEGSK